ncbi:MAG TPA: DUF2911 domain-containing protein [Planctomycetota bacterium]|nr:DUF2911 domain-containing protein [Planctomycetota bacterium]
MNKLIAVMFCGLLAVPVCAQEKVDVQKLQTQAQEAVQSEQWDVAAAAFKKLTEAEPKEGRNWHMLGYTLHAAGKLDEALKVHLKAAEFPEVAPVATYNAACVYALKGDKDKAFELLGKAIERGFAQPGQLDQDSDMDSLRADPRFKDIVAQTKKKAEAGGGRGQVQVFAPLTKRMGQRVAFFGGGGAPQLSLDYGPVNWNDKYDAMVSAEKMVGKKWRLGNDFWTSLDNSLPITIGGVEIPAGYYYLTLEQKADKSFVLGVHDAAEVKKQRIDAFMAATLKGGIEAPMQYSKVEGKADNLAITITMDKKSAGKSGELQIHFGNHQVSAKVECKLGS